MSASIAIIALYSTSIVKVPFDGYLEGARVGSVVGRLEGAVPRYERKILFDL
jgi:hypothetical protein